MRRKDDMAGKTVGLPQNKGSYTEARGPELADFMFMCGPGSKNGIIGLNGCEKSQEKYIS